MKRCCGVNRKHASSESGISNTTEKCEIALGFASDFKFLCAVSAKFQILLSAEVSLHFSLTLTFHFSLIVSFHFSLTLTLAAQCLWPPLPHLYCSHH